MATLQETEKFQREGTEADVQQRISAVMVEACADLADELRTVDLEFNVVTLDPHVTTRILDFRFKHVSDGHEVGFFRALAFVPVGSNDLKGNVTLTGFSLLLQLSLDGSRENITINESSTLETLEQRMAFKAQLMDIVRAAVGKWAK